VYQQAIERMLPVHALLRKERGYGETRDTIGGFYAIASIGKFRTAGLLGWFIWLFVHLMFLIGFRNRLVVGFQWLVTLTTFQRGAELITLRDEIP
jgi:NADH dehydrogenase FAD-containing subunit